MKKKIFLFILLQWMLLNVSQAHETGITLINHDRIWTYSKTSRNKGTDEKGDYTETAYILARFKFGETVEKYGRLYTEWKLIETVISNEVRYASDPENIISLGSHVEEEDRVMAYMREEDSKVYLLLDSEDLYIHDRDEDKDLKYFPEIGEETILYDFSIEIGGWYSSIFGGYLLTGMNAVKIEQVTVGEHSAKKIYVVCDSTRDHTEASNKTDLEWPDMLDPHLLLILGGAYVEGIGNVGPGGMTGWVDLITHLGWPTGSTLRLQNVCDGQGNEIFVQGNGSGQSGINNSGLTLMPEDDTMFDLFGKKIVSPAPGTLYIKNGKKFINK